MNLKKKKNNKCKASKCGDRFVLIMLTFLANC